MGLTKRFGANVRKLRLSAGFTQKSFADHAGLHRNYVSDLERGQHSPTLDVVEKVALALGVEAGSLLRDPSS